MANAVKGEHSFEVDGETYILLLDLNALCDAEAYVPGIMDDAAVKSFSGIRAVFWAGLQAHHPGLDLREAGRLIQAYGFKEAGALLGVAMKNAFTGGKEAGRPPKAGVKPGTGARS